MGQDRYRLPDYLGGHEVRLIDLDKRPGGFVRVLVETPDESYPIDLPRTVLVTVEPPPGLYLAADGVAPFIVVNGRTAAQVAGEP